jgi:hypothetical protein
MRDVIAVLTVLMVLSLGMLALVARTQTIAVTIPPGVPFKIEWKHDGLEMPEFRWWCDGAIVKNFSLSETPSVLLPDGVTYLYTATVPGLALGTHPCFISAFNGVGEVKAAPVPLLVKVPTAPSTPFDIRVVVPIRGGGGR